MYNKKGLSPLLSGVIYMTIILTGIIIVINTLYPQILQTKKNAEIKDTLSCYSRLSNAIQIISKSNIGTKEETPCSIKHASLNVKNQYLLFTFKNIKYKYLYIFNNYKKTIGDGVYVYDNNSYILMGNKYLEINITKQNTNINLSQIINSIIYKTKNIKIEGNEISFNLNNDHDLLTGKGYVTAEEYGNYLSYGKIICHISNVNKEYNLSIILYPECDYVVVGIEE